MRLSVHLRIVRPNRAISVSQPSLDMPPLATEGAILDDDLLGIIPTIYPQVKIVLIFCMVRVGAEGMKSRPGQTRDGEKDVH